MYKTLVRFHMVPGKPKNWKVEKKNEELIYEFCTNRPDGINIKICPSPSLSKQMQDSTCCII